jgi:hypothetical protein
MQDRYKISMHKEYTSIYVNTANDQHEYCYILFGKNCLVACVSTATTLLKPHKEVEKSVLEFLRHFIWMEDGRILQVTLQA